MTSTSKPMEPEFLEDSIDGAAKSKAFFESGSRAWRVIVLGSTAIWLMVAIDAFSAPGLDIMLLAVMFGTGMILAMAWSFWTFCLTHGYVRHGSRIEVTQWAFVPLTGLFGLVLLVTDLDLQLRVQLSEPALRTCVAELSAMSANGPDIFKGRRVGQFTFRDFTRRSGCLLMSIDCSYPHAGLVYSPAGAPPRFTPEYHFRHILGPWWSYIETY